ncbi:hypothetical protein PybrP1_000782 [[Pythium] brassicae (nom. inval.)]|nr:hypothetical protein PybrP1_000782 [[Pythium] brassicae (nom. inval.)]
MTVKPTDPLKLESSQLQHATGAMAPAGRGSDAISVCKPTLVREPEAIDNEDNGANGHAGEHSEDEGKGEDQAYSDDDLAFGMYERDDGAQCATQLLRESELSSSDSDERSARNGPMESVLQRTEPQAEAHIAPDSPSVCVYDESTYTIVSRLRAANKRLAAQLETQTRVVSTLQEEKKQHLQLIDTLHADLQMHKRTLRSFQLHSRRPHTTDDAAFPSRAGDRANNTVNALQQLQEKYAAKLEKSEQEKKDAQTRHGHQLANYSHELSRLERQLEHAHKATQEKESELRLQKIKQLYVHGGGAAGSDHHPRGLLADDFWKSLAPPDARRASSASLSTHIGLAFEQLLTHYAVSLHDHALDTSTREWLSELRACGAQLLQLHRSFEGMSCTFQRLAESTHLYQLAETLSRETRVLLRAEQSLVFVVDTAEQEFWCRVPRTADASDMVTVRSKLMPFVTSGHGSHPHPSAAVLPSSLGSQGDSHLAVLPPQLLPSGRLPCGLASMVFHTKKPLLIPAGFATKHPCFSTASDNTDRLVSRPGASTLLLPLVHAGQTLGVIQVSGKLAIVNALGLSIALEKSDAFSREDQALLQLLTHFAGGLFPKVAYFTEVESNKVNEETLIQLAPEIFTCLRFEELGKIVIENAKEILDADRCSLFVADNAERTLHNWQSDISGGAVQVYDSSKHEGMTIPFGHGVVGLVAETRQVINIPDAYCDPRFNSSWDKKTSYRTKSMLAVPILTNTTKRQPIRRASRSTSDKFSASAPAPPPLPPQQQQPGETSSDSILLGVVQVINKSGGAPFRAKDEFLLRTISKLIALAIENSQLFQKNQELCANLGKLIANADLVEAVICLGAAAEDIIGVESAALYVYDQRAQEMATFHRKRRHKTVLKEPMYRTSLFGDAVRTKELLIVNDVSAAPSFNAYVDTIGGTTVRNALFAPLVVDDPDALVGLGGATKLVGLLHLVNTKGRKASFERHDLFLSIVTSLCCSVVASILEKQVTLKQTEQTTLLLDTSMSFFREMSPIGVINAVYNACTNIFAVEKAHLFLWEPDRRHMWTAKLLPHAEANSLLSSPSSSSGDLRVGAAHESGQRTPALGAQLRRISVLTDQKLTVPTTEGLLEQVLVRGSVLLVKHWVDGADADTEAAEDARALPGQRNHGHKHSLRISASDDKFGFVKHSVVACPVWDTVGLEVVGILVLLFPRGRAPQLSELSNLPILCRQISGALSVCSDLRVVTARSRKLQSMLELSLKKPPVALSLTLSSRGQLVSFSQPVNLCTPGFSTGMLAACVHASTALNLDVRALPMDDEGHRWGFQLSATTMHELNAEHYAKWVGKGVVAPQAFDKLRADLQGVYVRKELATGEIDRRAAFPSRVGGSDRRSSALPPSLPKAVVLELRKLLWDFVDSSWRVDTRKASELFDAVDPTRQRRVSRKHLEQVLSAGGRGARLEQIDWDLLHTLFADPNSGLVPVERLFEALAPELRVVPHVAYEIVPVLDAVTQTVVSVHVVLTAL